MKAPTSAEIRAAVGIGHDLGAPLPPIQVADRLNAAHARVAESLDSDTPFDALLVTNLLNIRALTGFTGSAGRLLLWPDHCVFITDARYEARCADELRAAGCDATVVIRRSVLDQDVAIGQLVGRARLGLEDEHVTWRALRTYDERFEDAQLVAVSGFTESLRRTKTVGELALLARASAIADAAFLSTWTGLRLGPTESTFAVALIDAMRSLGAAGESFAPIIAGGTNGSRPHHSAGQRRVDDGDLVICDFGALVDGYHSDTTRTVSIGAPSVAQRLHLDVVRRAQAAGVDRVAPGVTGKAVDAACREVIAEAGWAEFFTTGTGHGSGLAIHEDPWCGETSTSVLAHGDVVTVEPGVYLEAAGVRIEDSVVVTDEGPVFLTCLPYELVLA